MENNIGSLMNVTMSKIREMVDVDTVVGTPVTTPDGMMIIPVSKVSYAFGGGGSDLNKNPNGFGGGSGAGVKIDPIGFLVIKEGNVRMINITPPNASAMERAIEKAPELLDKIEDFMSKRKENKEDKA